MEFDPWILSSNKKLNSFADIFTLGHRNMNQEPKTVAVSFVSLVITSSYNLENQATVAQNL
jgi:hypothetical protein